MKTKEEYVFEFEKFIIEAQLMLGRSGIVRFKAPSWRIDFGDTIKNMVAENLDCYTNDESVAYNLAYAIRRAGYASFKKRLIHGVDIWVVRWRFLEDKDKLQQEKAAIRENMRKALGLPPQIKMIKNPPRILFPKSVEQPA